MNKIDLAIKKLTEECQGNDYLVPFEECMTSICTTEAVAEKILQEDKTLTGAYETMRDIAKGRQKNGCAYIPPDEGLSILKKYFGIRESDTHSVIKAESTDGMIDITSLL